ncbi:MULTISPECIES: sensor histidine kinase [Caproicibacterium]|uniref:Histidine kinase n=1 Tax=Caproicibacterium argilliputei TaxID=3030016 RepID=A0AA97H2W9_9FIRM|nr:histidine kinase [Caproicibacterium argilliputei]WOC31638.1 histidine kinase [Caproicibacterium argilliputei]
MKTKCKKHRKMRWKDDYERGKKSLRMKVFLLNLGVVLGALFLFCGIFLSVTSGSLRQESMRAVQSALDQAGVMLEEQTQAFRSSADSLCLDDSNVELLNRDNADRYRTVTNWNQDYVLLKKRISSLLFRSNISDVKIITENAVSMYDTQTVISFDRVKNTKWYKQISTSKSAYAWSSYSSLFPNAHEDADMLIFTRDLPYEYANYRTYYVGCVKKENFNGLLSAGAADSYTAYYVVNSDNEVLLSSKTDIPQADVQQMVGWVKGRYKQSEQAVSVQPLMLGSGQYFVGSQPIYNTDLKIVCACAFYAKRGDSIRGNLFSMSVVAAAVLPLVLLFSLLISRSITRPLERLQENMMIVSEGNFDVPIVAPSSDREIHALTRCFNYMLFKISDLLDKQYNYGKRIKELEVKSLQAQINPHFLYNTLDLIKWKAVKYRDSDVQNLVTALSDYYRRGLSKGADVVTLQSEIEHVTSYVYIQNMRFDDCVRLHCLVDAESRDCLLPKLTLQPLVENAITHGILETDAGCGNVLIRTFHTGAVLYIAVVDDGCGMEAEKARHILQYATSSPVTGSGYGIKNINERIRLAYGEEYGVSFISYPQRGTAAVLKLPFQRKEKSGNV